MNGIYQIRRALRIKKRYKVISIHSRKQHNLEQAVALYQLYKDAFVHITSMYFSDAAIGRMKVISKRAAGLMAKRNIEGLPKSTVVNLPLTEIKRKLAPALRYYYSPYMQDRDFQKEIIKKVDPPEICIAVDGLSYSLFRTWKGRSKLVLDLTVALPQYMLVTRFGGQYNADMLTNTDEFHQRLYNNYFTEVELADIILCGSEFVRQSIVYFKPELEAKCRILPYGANTSQFCFAGRQFEEKTKLKFVTVGTVDKRKGADTSFAAWKNFLQQHPECELHFFGLVNEEEIDVKIIPRNVFLHGRVATGELVKQLGEMDVFVLPTLHEGSSIAVYQAMAMQLPVITTFNSGTVLKHGESCELVKAGDSGQLLAAMNKLYLDVNYREKLAKNAFILSKEYTWDKYKQRLAEILNENQH